jgi:hypothetical protein
MCRKPVPPSESIWTSTTVGGHIRAWVGRRRIRPTSTRCSQSRLRHNQRQKPLIKLPRTVQTNRATSLLALRNIGASICFYWNLAGILAREDWFAARACLQAKLRHDSGEIPFASVLPLMAFESTDWKFLKGLENRTVPGSDFFSEIFKSDANDISIAEDESDYLFDKTEIVVMLEFSHHRIDRVEKSGVWFFMPVGSFIWREHGRQLKETLERISALPDTDPFFKAGLLGGSNAKAAPTLKKIRDFAQEHYSRHLSW